MTLPPLPSTAPEPLTPAVRRLMMGGMAVAHLAGAWALLQWLPVRPALSPEALMVVERVALEQPAPPPPPDPPRPLPRTPTPLPASPQPLIVSTPTPAAAPNFVAPPSMEAAAAAPATPATPPAPAAPPPPVAAAAPRTVAITAVEYLTPPVLNYPLASRRLREAGRVDVRVLVDARGLPGAMQLQHSSGFERLDEEALAAVRATRFKPYTENGIAQPFWVVMPLAFELN